MQTRPHPIKLASAMSRGISKACQCRCAAPSASPGRSAAQAPRRRPWARDPSPIGACAGSSRRPFKLCFWLCQARPSSPLPPCTEGEVDLRVAVAIHFKHDTTGARFQTQLLFLNCIQRDFQCRRAAESLQKSSRTRTSCQAHKKTT